MLQILSAEYRRKTAHSLQVTAELLLSVLGISTAVLLDIVVKMCTCETFEMYT